MQLSLSGTGEIALAVQSSGMAAAVSAVSDWHCPQKRIGQSLGDWHSGGAKSIKILPRIIDGQAGIPALD
jgi:hypothetical protein